MQLVRKDQIQNTDFLNTILQDLGDLQSMEDALTEAQDKVSKDGDLSDAGKARSMLATAEKQIGPRLERAQNRVQELTESADNVIRDLVEYELNPDDTDTRSAIREQEIRAAFKGASTDQIIEALRDAEQAEDAETLRAIEGAPRPVAVGDQDMIRRNRNERLRRRYPEQMQNHDDMRDAIEIYTAVRDALQDRLQKLRAAVGSKGAAKSNYERFKEANPEVVERMSAEE
jgi:hypothetical protein